MDIHLEDRWNHLLFFHVQLNFFLPTRVFFHMGISLRKKKTRNQNPKQQKATRILLYWTHSKIGNVFSEAMSAEKLISSLGAWILKNNVKQLSKEVVFFCLETARNAFPIRVEALTASLTQSHQLTCLRYTSTQCESSGCRLECRSDPDKLCSLHIFFVPADFKSVVQSAQHPWQSETEAKSWGVHLAILCLGRAKAVPRANTLFWCASPQTTLFTCIHSLLDSSRLHISVLPEPACKDWQ